ncbi:uncharacterized protein PV09_08832 [Verruconis gallopava]|uniref:Uncharacterized protein n=1 Tax=Verruconis gallopava TaxID=253628 RepID=A0A0D1XBG6_9PEZI|nr:uncharacterized protein PV09_08832 [Verruconis gallopava]KIV99530.1 hypothetical protein PV09_08832 [Verruconis gallopava]
MSLLHIAGMVAQPYSRLSVTKLTTEIPLSSLSSEDDAHIISAWQGQDLGLNITCGRKKRGFFAAIEGWWLEVGSVALAFAVMLVIIILLVHYNGEPIENTPRRPSLNTLINIFSAIEAGMIAYVAAEVLSQSKWLNMQSKSSLDDLNTIDNASRGLRGALQVVFKPRLGPMPFVGAITTLLAVIIGPMLQETIVLRTAWRPSPIRNATVPVSKYFAPDTNPELPKLDVGMKGVILNGLSSANSSVLTPQFGCPSGNCTYSTPYSSLAICHSCQRVELTRQCTQFDNCNYTLSNGHTLINPPIRGNYSGDFAFINVSTSFNLTRQMAIPYNEITDQYDILRASIISLTNGPLCHSNGTNPDCVLDNRDNATQAKLFDGGAIGAYCDLFLCVNTYTASVSESSVSEQIIGSSNARNTSRPQYSFAAIDRTGADHPSEVILPDECYIGGIRYSVAEYKDSSNQSWTYVELNQTVQAKKSFSTTKVPIECIFGMRGVTYQSMFQFMTSNPFFLDGNGVSDSNTGVAGGLFSFYSNAITQSLPNTAAFGVEPLFNNGNASFESIDATFERLASAMTTYMRDNSEHSGSVDFTGLEKQLASMSSSALGILFHSETVISVQWYWIILPLFVLVIICIYLAAAVLHGGVMDHDGNTQAHLWKSNILVPLAIGYRSELPQSSEALYSRDAMQTFKKGQVQLASSKDGWLLVQSKGNDLG